MGLYKNNNGTLELISGATLYADNPIGTILPYGGATAPLGWLLCQGQAVSRTEYAELFAVIGTAFGNGDGVNTFNLPDPRNKFLEGASTTNPVGTEKSAGLPNIKGGITGGALCSLTGISGAFAASASASSFYNQNGDFQRYAFTFDANKSNSIYSDSVDTVQPPAVCTNFIIKAKQVAAPADFAGIAEAAGTAAAEEVVALKQNITDNSLETTTKTVVGAINEVNENKLERKYIAAPNVDLNTCTDPGIYEINTPYSTNKPTDADGGTMLVTYNPSNNIIVQAYFATNGVIANRYKNNTLAWTNWVSPFDNRPQLYYAKNVQATSDASANIILANSKDNVVIVGVRIRGNNTWSLGYSTTAGYYIHVQGYGGEALPNTTVYYDVIYYQYDWTA